MAKGGEKAAIGTVVGMLLHYGFSCLIAHQGRTTNGEFHLALALLTVLMAFSSLGLGAGVARFVSLYAGQNDAGRQRGVVRLALVFNLFSGAIFGAGLVLLREPLARLLGGGEGLSQILLVTGVMLPLRNLTHVLREVLMAAKRVGLRVLVFDIVGNVVLLGAGGALVYMGYGALGAVLAQLLAFAVGCVLAWGLVRWGNVFPRCRARTGDVLRELMRFSLPVLVSVFVAEMLVNADLLMLGWLKSPAEAGLYRGVFLLLTPANLAALLVSPLVIPLVTREYARGNMNEARDCTRMAGRWLMLLLAPIVLTAILMRKELAMVLLGADYHVRPALILAIGAARCFTFLVLPGKTLLVASGKVSRLPAVSLAVLGLNLGLNWLVIPHWGALGAAAATSVALLLQLGLVSLLAARIEGIRHALTGFVIDGAKISAVGIISLAVGWFGALALGAGLVVNLALSVGALTLMLLLFLIFRVFRPLDMYVIAAGFRRYKLGWAVPVVGRLIRSSWRGTDESSDISKE
jgi:O-antigen/teichoic acid export membrane protein